MRFFVLLFVLCSVNGLGFYKCPKQQSMKNFDITKFTGRWYEVERTFYMWEIYTRCLRLDVSIKKPGQISLLALRINRLSGNEKLVEGVGTVSKKGPGFYQVRVSTALPKLVDKFMPGSATYQVLDTDYENYAVVWACSSYGIIHYDRIWILGRNWDINVDVRAKIYNFLHSHDIDSERLMVFSKNCNL